MEYYVYIVSISFQLAGALLLLLFIMSTKRRKVIMRFLSNGFISRDGNTNELNYKEDAFKNHFSEAYLAKCSFFYIVVGYLTGVFGLNSSENIFCSFILILICTFLFIIITLLFVKTIMKYKKGINIKITYDELIELGLSPDIASIPNEAGL
jgi:hypothetical protein